MKLEQLAINIKQIIADFINIKDMDSDKLISLLHQSYQTGGIDMLQRLLDSDFLPPNFDLSQTDIFGRSLMDFAVSYDDNTFIRLLRGINKVKNHNIDKIVFREGSAGDTRGCLWCSLKQKVVCFLFSSSWPSSLSGTCAPPCLPDSV